MSDTMWVVLVALGGVAAMLGGAYWSYRQRMVPTPLEGDVNVGITTGTLILGNGDIYTVTIPGVAERAEGWWIPSDHLFDQILVGQWIPVDQGGLLNRDVVVWVKDRKTKEFYL